MRGPLTEVGYDSFKHDTAIAVIKQRGLADITSVIYAVIELYSQLYEQNAHDINFGNCEAFACDVIDILGGFCNKLSGMWDSDGQHYFIIYKGKYYDSEAPEGVHNFKELPCFRDSIIFDQ